MTQTSVVIGATGQDGSYLIPKLLGLGHKVYGMKRRASSLNTQRLDDIYQDPHDNNQLELVYGDLSDYSSIASLIGDTKPDLVFNLGCQSMVRVSYDIPEYTFDVGATGALRVMEAIRKCSPKSRSLFAASSEMFGSTAPPQNETTAFHPRSPYAISKVAGYWTTINYRESYGLHASNAISFNHESKNRAENFVTRKITRGAARIKMGLQNKLFLGNLSAKRDWSHASDMIDAMYLIITADEPDDYVVASGQMHSVREFAEVVFSQLGMDYKEYVEFDKRYLRPAEVDALMGDATKIKNKLGWQPKYTFDMLVKEMIDYDMKLAKQELILKNNDD